MPNETAKSTPAVMPLYLAAIASGGLLYTSFFPLNLGFLAWVALVPLLFLVRSTARSRHIYLAAFVGGLAFYVPALQWMHVAHAAMYATWAFLALMCTAYLTFGIFAIRALDRRNVPLALAAPTVWVGLEYMRAHFPTAFPWLEPLGVLHRIGFGWYFLGYSQHDYLPLIQIADITGVYGVSFLIVLVNTVLFLWVARSRELESRPADAPRAATAVAALLLAGTLTYGGIRLEHAAFETGPRVALLQSNLPQSVKMGDEKIVRDHMADLLHRAVSVLAKESPDLIVWPETTATQNWCDIAAGVDFDTVGMQWRNYMAVSDFFAQSLAGMQTNYLFPKENPDFDVYARAISGRPTNQLVGISAVDLDANGKLWKFNSAKFIDKDGVHGPRYDKMHLVPFGEYVPLGDVFPWLQAFTPYSHEYSCKPGEHWTRFKFKAPHAEREDYCFGCIICYEDSDPTLARNYVRPSPEGPAVDFLVNISNDGWFNGTEEHEQHFAICRFRAIECRRSVVRAVNMGISGIIDSDGRVVQIPGPTWAESKKVAGVVNGVVPIDHRASIYSQWGDWLPLACWGVVLLAFVVAWWRRRSIAP